MGSKGLLRDIILFLIILMLSLCVFYLLEYALPLEWPIVKLFNHLGYVDSFGHTTLGNVDVLIDYQCSGFFSIFVFLAFIFSPISTIALRRKFWVALLGILVLYLANILRLFLFFWLGPYIGLENMHILGWFLMSLVIFALWYFWGVEKETKTNNNKLKSKSKS
jgi:exosortase/archaeosortase family protein